MSSAQVFPFIFPHLLYFIIFTASSNLLFSSKDNVSGSMGVMTGFPAMGPLSICLNYFTIADTAFYPKILMLEFSDIWVNMTFVATFINEYVSSFDYFYLINNLFPDL